MNNLALYEEYKMMRLNNHKYGINIIYYNSIIEKRNNFRSSAHALICGNLSNLGKLRNIIKFFVDNDYIF